MVSVWKEFDNAAFTTQGRDYGFNLTIETIATHALGFLILFSFVRNINQCFYSNDISMIKGRIHQLEVGVYEIVMIVQKIK